METCFKKINFKILITLVSANVVGKDAGLKILKNDQS
jgi:hypothetical protein